MSSKHLARFYVRAPATVVLEAAGGILLDVLDCYDTAHAEAVMHALNEQLQGAQRYVSWRRRSTESLRITPEKE